MKSTIQQRPIQDMVKFEGSIREFDKMFYSKGIIGASDLDFFYERKGNFLILEGKQMPKDSTIIYYGQMMALVRMNKLSEKMNIFVIFQKQELFSIVPIEKFSRGWEKINNKWCQVVKSSSLIWINKDELGKTVAKITESFE